MKNAVERDNVDSQASIASSLLLAIQSKDDAGWKRFENLFGPVIETWLLKSRMHHADASDLKQEVLHQVWLKVGDFRRGGMGTTFRGWLWTITRNKLRDHFRRQDRTPQAQGGSQAIEQLAQLAEPADDSTMSPPTTEREELQGLVTRAVKLVQQDVAPQTWQSFWLTAVEGCTAAEAAAKLNVGVGSVYTAKSRVLVRLREVLGDDCEPLLNWI